MVKHFRDCGGGCERSRPILCLTTREMERVSQLAEVTGCSWSEMIESILRDWLTTDLEQLADMKGGSYYALPPFGVGVGQ